LSLDTCLSKLRYVKYGDEVRADDVNTKVECIRVLRDTSKAKAAELGCPSERVDPLVEELDSILATIRYVRSGDIIQPEDHNYVVDALKKARDILAEIEAFCSGLKAQLDRCLEELKRLVVVPATLLGPAAAAVKPPDAEARANLVTVVGVAAKPADARSDISFGVSVSVRVS
jgi:hypothetical protein